MAPATQDQTEEATSVLVLQDLGKYTRYISKHTVLYLILSEQGQRIPYFEYFPEKK